MRVLNISANWQAYTGYVRFLARHRQLTWEMAKLELTERYAGHVFGALWAVLHPLVIIGVYLFIFGVVYKMRMDSPGATGIGDFSLYILSGLIPWMTFSEVLAKSTSAITGNANLVKQVIFPIEILPAKSVLASFITQLFLVSALLIYAMAAFHVVPATWILIPVLLLFQFMGMLGLALILSSVGAYFRDIKEVVQVFCLVNVYLMPVVYLPQWVPWYFAPLLYLNPFSYQTWCYQDVIFYGRIAHPWAWPPFIILNVTALALGYRFFRKLKCYFGNVL